MSKLRKFMNKFNKGALSTMAAMALVVTASNVSTCCWFVLGQDELPENAKKLRHRK
ncbi:MAG: cyclic lactone autoinducer peptide [Lachnospiraceae bacterium]|nr:cyclic lactone autoinducer peptide [Lachnospiraceae bacterium]